MKLSGGFAVLHRIWKYNIARSEVFAHKLRVVGLASLIAITAINLLHAARILEGLQDDAVLYTERLEPLRPYLPRTGQIGYVTDALSTDAFSDEHLKKYYLTQYTLVPLVIQFGTESDVIIGDFPDSASAAKHTAGFILLKDFGGGLMLLRNKPE